MPPTIPPGFSIHPVTPPDLPTIASYLQSSKLRLVINRLLIANWPNLEFQNGLYTGAVTGALSDPSVTSIKVIDDKSGEIVGYLALTRRQPVEQQEVEGDEKQPGNLPGLNPDILPAIHSATMKVAGASSGFEHFDITYIYISPSYRKLGLGTALMEFAFHIAAEEKIPMALSSEPEAYGFFQKLGFRDTIFADIDLARWAPAYSGFGIFRLAGMVKENF